MISGAEPFWSRRATILAWLLVAIGAILRLARWSHWRSLWLDEIYLAGSITTRSLHDLLFKPLENWQAAPAGFLVLVHLCVRLMGSGEQSLRLISLVFGLAALPLALLVARRMLRPRGGLVALALMAFLGPLIYYSNELKPYSCDVAMSLAIMLGTLRLIEKPTAGRAAVAAIVGAAGIFLSFPAIFVLAGAGIVALWRLRGRSEVRVVGMVCLVWGVFFVVDYLVFIHPLANGDAHPHLVAYWTSYDAFMPRTPLAATEWLFSCFHEIARDPGAMWLDYPDAAVAMLLVGIIVVLGRRHVLGSAPQSASFFSPSPCTQGEGRGEGLSVIRLRKDDPHPNPLPEYKERGQKEEIGRMSHAPCLLLLLAPLPFVLLASALRQYPFGDRLALFYVPQMLLLIGVACDALWTDWPAKAAGLVLVGMMFVPSAWRGADLLFHPPGREESLPAYRWMAGQWRDGDVIYLTKFAEPSFRYYRDQIGWRDAAGVDAAVHVQPTIIKPGNIFEDVERMAGRKRVWVILIHADGGDIDVHQLTRLAFDTIGRPIEDHIEPGAEVFLYDCASPRRQESALRATPLNG